MAKQQSPVKASVVVASAAGFGVLAVATVVLTYTALRWTPRGPTNSGPHHPPGPVVLVEAAWPGAGAAEVARVLADPLEAQAQKIPGLRHLTSRCDDDGAYRLAVEFDRGIPPDQALAAVREVVGRVRPGLAGPGRHEITVREEPAPLQLLVLVSSPSPTHDIVFLSKYTLREVKTKLARLAGVAEVALYGGCEPCASVRLDREKMTARGVTAADVGRAVRELKGQILPGTPVFFDIPWGPALPALDKFGDTALKADAGGQIVRLKDVAECREACHPTGMAVWNGKPAVGLGIFPARAARAGELSAAVRAELANLQATLPKEVRVEVVFDLSAENPAYLLLDVLLPDAASRERTEKTLRRCAGLVKPFAGDVLELTDPPFPGAARRSNQGYVLLRLNADDAAGRDQARQEVRKQLPTEIPEAVVNLRDVSGGEHAAPWSSPLVLAVHGPAYAEVQVLADELLNRLDKSEKVTDVAATRGPFAPSLRLTVDAEAAKQHGVAPQDVRDAVAVEIATREFRDVGETTLRDGKGQPIPLRRLIRVDADQGGSLRRFNGRPMARVTANLAPGVRPDDVRPLCEELFAAVRKERRLPEEYRLNWLDE